MLLRSSCPRLCICVLTMVHAPSPSRQYVCGCPAAEVRRLQSEVARLSDIRKRFVSMCSSLYTQLQSSKLSDVINKVRSGSACASSASMHRVLPGRALPTHSLTRQRRQRAGLGCCMAMWLVMFLWRCECRARHSWGGSVRSWWRSLRLDESCG